MLQANLLDCYIYRIGISPDPTPEKGRDLLFFYDLLFVVVVTRLSRNHLHRSEGPLESCRPVL
jgi:hypothetical protein